LGLSLAYNLFWQVTPSQVFDALALFYEQRGADLGQPSKYASDFINRRFDDDSSLELFDPNGGWTVMVLDRGWASQWEVRREAQLFVSRILACSGFLIRVYDGDYWAYELFANGELKDHFVQEVETSEGRPPGTDAGSAAAVASIFPWLKVEDVSPYLVQQNWDDPDERKRLNIPARAGDEFRRFDQCSVLDFLRLLKLQVSLVDRYVTLASPRWKQFWIMPL